MAARLRKKPPPKEKIVEESAGYRLKKEKEELKKKIAELGLERKEFELPPDEVDEKDVERSAYTSLLAMVPYTQEWWEAKAAEEELDDLTKIRGEIARANELVAMTKIGKHEEALAEMMDETNNDFHYFNKLKNSETNKGRFNYVPKTLNPFKDISQGRNRLKKALRLQFDLVDATLLKQLNNRARGLGRNKADDGRDKKCQWRFVRYHILMLPMNLLSSGKF